MLHMSLSVLLPFRHKYPPYAHGVWGQGRAFDGKSYLPRDICQDQQTPKQLKVPTKRKPAKPAAKRAAHHPTLNLEPNCPLRAPKSQGRLVSQKEVSDSGCGKGTREKGTFFFDRIYDTRVLHALMLQALQQHCSIAGEGIKVKVTAPPPLGGGIARGGGFEGA